MWFRKLAFAILFFSAIANLAQAAGLKILEVPADTGGPALRLAEWTPCASPPAQIQLGPFALEAVRDCPVAGEKLPLIVVSHGFGGTYLGHHDTAETLADAGFVVVALNHPDDNAMNEAKARNLTALISRPVDIRRLIDFMLGPAADATKIDPQRVGFFGFSRGGYTGLVLAGAVPDFRALASRCQDPTGASCDRVSQDSLPTLAPSRDPRIKAFAIADPLSSVFPTAESLKDITAPIQLWASERGGDGVSPQDVAAVARNLPVKADVQIVANAGHFAFLTVCPPELAKSLPDICTDRPGFDRAAFHRTLDAQVLAFFRRSLTATAQL
jgi:predicted dienelactone hydrolase